MRAGDLTPGWYHAHGSKTADCLIKEATIQDHEILLSYEYVGEARRAWYSLDKEWTVVREQVEIPEETDWVALLVEP